MLEELNDAFSAAESSDSIRAVIVTGTGDKAFAAGADIVEMSEFAPQQALEFARYGVRVFRKLSTMAKPVIAAVNGYALGGGNELAMWADIRIASKNARFGQPEVGLGIIPGFGGTQRLIRLVGSARAMDLVVTGRIIDAEEAYRIGLVSKVVDEGQALSESKALARELVTKSIHAIALAKKAILSGGSMTLDDGLLLEERVFSECFAHPDQREGMKAFLEKRAPRFA